MSTAAWALGLHLLTAHSNTALEPVNPGVYLRAPSGITAGVLRNSYLRASTYVGYTAQTEDQRFAITAGVITGYPVARVIPLLALSTRVPLGTAPDAPSLRLSFLPKPPKGGTGTAVHASIEFALGGS